MLLVFEVYLVSVIDFSSFKWVLLTNQVLEMSGMTNFRNKRNMSFY